MQLVAHDGSSDRSTGLLIGVRQHAPGNRIGRVETVASEIGERGPGSLVGAGLRDRLHLNTDRPPLGDVEQICYDLELCNRFAAEARLAEARAASPRRQTSAQAGTLSLHRSPRRAQQAARSGGSRAPSRPVPSAPSTATRPPWTEKA